MKIRGVLLTLLGFLMCLPYWFLIFWLEHSYHYMSLLISLSLFFMLIGGPLFLIGIVMIFIPRSGSNNFNDIELSRIRYATETSARKENK